MSVTKLDRAICDICGQDEPSTHWKDGKQGGTAICDVCERQPPTPTVKHLMKALEYLAKEAGYDVTYLQTGEVGLSKRDGVGAIVL